jgi:hypothetical protein
MLIPVSPAMNTPAALACNKVRRFMAGNLLQRPSHYAERAIEPALAAIAAARSTTVQILDGLSEAEWGRTGTHSEDGPYGIERWLEIYAVHCRDHADQIRRAAVGA